MRDEIAKAILGRDATDLIIRFQESAVADIKNSWNTAREAAKLLDLLFHDLRRTALTMMIDTGFSKKEAMEISGHKTRAVFDRYHIVSPERSREKADRLEKHLQAQNEITSPKKSPPGKDKFTRGVKKPIFSGERGRNRTFNLLIKSQLLCQLSYAPTIVEKLGGSHPPPKPID